MPASAAGKTIEVWFQDESRVGQQGGLTRIWAPKGSRPVKTRDCRHVSAYLFGAVCPERATGAALVMPHVNTEAMNHHLQEIAKQVAPGAHAVVVCDGAGWHQTGGGLAVPDNLTLLRLPPYAPELNPMENVWAFLKSNHLALLVWNTYDAIEHACCRAWNAFVQQPDRVRSITTRSYAHV